MEKGAGAYQTKFEASPSIFAPICFLVQLCAPSAPITYMALMTSTRPDLAFACITELSQSSGDRLLRKSPFRTSAEEDSYTDEGFASSSLSVLTVAVAEYAPGGHFQAFHHTQATLQSLRARCAN
ncbi:hypothetical protein MPH_08453 [Macrophomina phaseolina MS6]|uniref:Uncharacterized protein n=1 Tax=Macrophomina phaseolina (strain MS6) TaxID=1126212 RepID=K2RNH9_MACPH|nr:hypothetical protein MPH_08453 [Macrophomina phaseolina MS6]